MTTITERRGMWRRLCHIADSLASKFQTRAGAFAEAIRQRPDLAHGALAPDTPAGARKPKPAARPAQQKPKEKKPQDKKPDACELMREERIRHALMDPYMQAVDYRPVKPAESNAAVPPSGETRASAVRRFLAAWIATGHRF